MAAANTFTAQDSGYRLMALPTYVQGQLQYRITVFQEGARGPVGEWTTDQVLDTLDDIEAALNADFGVDAGDFQNLPQDDVDLPAGVMGGNLAEL